MNAPINMFAGAPTGAGIVDASFVASLGKPVNMIADGSGLRVRDDFGVAEMKDRFGRIFYDGIRSGRLDRRTRTHTDAAEASDAAENFVTNQLEQMLTALVRKPPSTNLMTGPSSLIPVRSTLRPGQLYVGYDIESPTGQAGFVEPDGMMDLPQVGEFAERKRHEATWAGIGYGWGLIESWTAAEMGKSLDTSRATTARDTLQRFCERVLLFGANTHKLTGIRAHMQAMMLELDTNMEDEVATPNDALIMLQIIDHAFSRIASSYNGQITGGIAPKQDLYFLQQMRYGSAGEGGQALPGFKTMLPWLNSIEWIDGMNAASTQTGPLWVLWSDDANELWSEMDPVPTLYGPFTDGKLRTSFVLLTHIGGVIVRRRERILACHFDD